MKCGYRRLSGSRIPIERLAGIAKSVRVQRGVHGVFYSLVLRSQSWLVIGLGQFKLGRVREAFMRGSSLSSNHRSGWVSVVQVGFTGRTCPFEGVCEWEWSESGSEIRALASNPLERGAVSLTSSPPLSPSPSPWRSPWLLDQLSLLTSSASSSSFSSLHHLFFLHDILQIGHIRFAHLDLARADIARFVEGNRMAGRVVLPREPRLHRTGNPLDYPLGVVGLQPELQYRFPILNSE